jgi:alpha-L-fucosidase 2
MTKTLWKLAFFLLCTLPAAAQVPGPADAPAPPRIPTQDSIVYGIADGQSLTMDYYAPKADAVAPKPDIPFTKTEIPFIKGETLHPIAILIHGGGYHSGTSKNDSEAYMADFLAPAGYAVFSINYRLAPKYPYPFMILDAQRAVRYIRYHAKEWNADPDRIALIGGSAGGYLSTMVGLLNGPPDLNSADPVDRVSAEVQAVVSLYSQSSFEHLPLNADTHLFLDPLIARSGDWAALREASPLTYVLRGAPPFMLILGDQDEYIPMSEATNLQAALDDAHVRCDILVIPGGKHGTTDWHKLPAVPDWERLMTTWLNERLDHKGPIGEGIRARTMAIPPSPPPPSLTPKPKFPLNVIDQILHPNREAEPQH